MKMIRMESEEETSDVDLKEDRSFLTKDKEAPTFEHVLGKLGRTGKFHYIQSLLCMSPLMAAAFVSLAFVFTGYTPPHKCKSVNETHLLWQYNLLKDHTAKISYGECDITIHAKRDGHMTEIASLSCLNGHYFPQGKHMTIVSEWDLVCENTGQAEIMALLNTLGNVVGGIFIPALADRYGRKPAICTASIINIFLELAMAFAPSLTIMNFFSFLDGIVFAGISCTYLVLGMELFVARKRQIYGVFVCQYFVFSSLAVGIFGYILRNVSWRYLHAAGALTGLTALAMPFLLYESPRWLSIHKRSKEALAVLEEACRQNGTDFLPVKKTFNQYMNHILENEKHQETTTKKVNGEGMLKYTLLSMLQRREMCVLLLVIWYMWTTCNLTYYGLYMSSSNLAGNRYLNYCLLVIVELPSNFLSLYLMGRMGRLTVVRLFLLIAAACLFLSCWLTTLTGDTFHIDALIVILFLLGKFAVSGAFSAVYVFTPEVFPTVLRSTGYGSCKSIPKVGAMLAPYTRPLYAVAKWAPGTLFTTMCILALFMSYMLPETKDTDMPSQLEDVNTKNTRAFLSRHKMVGKE